MELEECFYLHKGSYRTSSREREGIENMEKTKLAQFLLQAAEETFSMMLGLAVVSRKEPIPAVDSPSERVVALIGIAGLYHGTGLIACSSALACRFASQMLMTEYSAVDGEVLDAIGEIANMIFGNVKTLLEEEVGLLGLSIPTVIHGRNFSTRTVIEQSVVIPFEVEGETFELRLCLSQNLQSGKPCTPQQMVAELI